MVEMYLYVVPYSTSLWVAICGGKFDQKKTVYVAEYLQVQLTEN